MLYDPIPQQIHARRQSASTEMLDPFLAPAPTQLGQLRIKRWSSFERIARGPGDA
jgi:hypothetical protein